MSSKVKILMCIFLLSLCTQTQASSKILGKWKTHTQKGGGFGTVQFYKCGSKYCGKLIRTQLANGKKDPNFPYRGRVIVKGLSYSNGTYSKGTILEPDTGKVFSAILKPGSRTMKVKGCVAGGLFCRSYTWKRVK